MRTQWSLVAAVVVLSACGESEYGRVETARGSGDFGRVRQSVLAVRAPQADDGYRGWVFQAVLSTGDEDLCEALRRRDPVAFGDATLLWLEFRMGMDPPRAPEEAGPDGEPNLGLYPVTPQAGTEERNAPHAVARVLRAGEEGWELGAGAAQGVAGRADLRSLTQAEGYGTFRIDFEGEGAEGTQLTGRFNAPRCDAPAMSIPDPRAAQ